MNRYNNFGEMFEKTTGRSVFNGIAQTKVQHRDSYGNNEEVYIRLSTENPKKDVAFAWSEDGSKFKPFKSGEVPKWVKAELKKQKLPEIRTRIEKKVADITAKHPKFNSTKISDSNLIEQLNKYGPSIGSKFMWTDINATTSKSESKNGEKGSSDTKKPDINVVKATGIFKSNGKTTFVKFGFEHGSPFAMRFDENGNQLGLIPPENIVGKDYAEGCKESPEAFAKDSEDKLVHFLSYLCKQRGLTVEDCLWKGGNVDVKALNKEFNDTLQSRKAQAKTEEADRQKEMEKAEKADFDKKSIIGQLGSKAVGGVGKVLKKSGIKKFFIGD